jgi:hypothetical protein
MPLASRNDSAPHVLQSRMSARAEAQAVDVACGLPNEARLEPRDPAAVLPDLDLLGVSEERRPRGVELVVVARLLVVVDGVLLRR